MDIPNFSKYNLIDNEVFRIKDGTKVTTQKNNKLKLKHDLNGWKSISLASVKALCGQVLSLPKTAKEIPYTDGKYYIDTLGNVYSFSSMYPAGNKLVNSISTNGYPTVHLTFKGKSRTVEVHQLMCRTFILEDYIEKGLVCLHTDDVKTNIKLSNLSVGTYSKNNRDAYKTGVNLGNGLKKT